jgi:peptidoglycan hydrolase CwlO-like protein
VAKVEISDSELNKLIDDASKHRIKELEKQVASLERRLETQKKKVAELKTREEEVINTWRTLQSALSEVAHSTTMLDHMMEWV